MPFLVSMNNVVKEKVKRLVNLPNTGTSLKAFWTDLASVLKEITNGPLEIGEPVFDYKHAKYQCKLVVIGAIAIQFAVNEEHGLIVVQRISISGNNPYRPDVEEILNREPF